MLQVSSQISQSLLIRIVGVGFVWAEVVVGFALFRRPARRREHFIG